MWTMCEIVLWCTTSSVSCVKKWALNSRYFFTIQMFVVILGTGAESCLQSFPFWTTVSKIEDVCGIGDSSVLIEQNSGTHLDELAKSLDRYFPTRASYPVWVRHICYWDSTWWIPRRNHWTSAETDSTATLQNNNALNVLVSTNEKAIVFKDAGHNN